MVARTRIIVLKRVSGLARPAVGSEVAEHWMVTYDRTLQLPPPLLTGAQAGTKMADLAGFPTSETNNAAL